MNNPAMKLRDLVVEQVPIDRLIPYANNARTHSKAQIGKIVRSLQANGWTNPLLVDESSNVLCGHGRLEAAKQLGIKAVPVIRLSDMTEAQKRAYIIADNALAERSSWSKELLSIELQGLIDVGYDVELTGFDTIEIDNFLSVDAQEDASPEEDPVEVPDDTPPVTQLDDLWIIGDHRLICGDARDRRTYERLMGDDLAQMIFTDPPYNVLIRGNVSGLGKHKHDEFVMGSGEMSDSEFVMNLLRPAFRCMARYSQTAAIAFVCMDWRGGPQLLDAADGVFHELKNLIVWGKTNAALGAFYRSQHELIYAFKTSKGRHINNFGLGEGGRHRSNLWIYPGCNTFRRGRAADLADHPTIKPKKLVADAILDCSKRGGIILDSFAGSGTTLAAAEATGGRGYGIELDPRYCDVILRRIEAATGEAARLETGESFTEVAAARRS